MDFKDISFKMFKANINKYRLFILCNILCIAIVYSFISIVENKEFMNPQIVDTMISSNIYAPAFMILGFAAMFIPYTQSTFMKSRQKDYGILLSLGLSEKEMVSSIFLEDFMMGIVSLISGLILGTVFNFFFLYFIKNVIAIEGIHITISKISYIIVSIYAFILYVIS